MRENRLKTIWQGGGMALNAWLGINSTMTAEVMARLDWDAVTIDMQHSLIDWATLVPMLQAVSTTDKVPIVRVPWNEPVGIMRALDAGAYGIICPMIDSRADCEAFVGAARYAPQGYRSWGPVRGLIYGGPDYFEHANDTVLTFAMIETRAALDDLDAIMSTPGLDGAYVGPNDLAIGLGQAPRYEPTGAVGAALDDILAAAVRHNVVPGIQCGSAAMARDMAEKGFRLVSLLSDTRFMVMAADQAIATIRGRTAR